MSSASSACTRPAVEANGLISYVARLAPAGWKDKHNFYAQTENLPNEQEIDIEIASSREKCLLKPVDQKDL